ncbi:hypothetical protein J1614_010825 [Plenodomus biglobosus]|nr:hypothetical protein J1614_010825 [Plenodomus biglobosus]
MLLRINPRLSRSTTSLRTRNFAISAMRRATTQADSATDHANADSAPATQKATHSGKDEGSRVLRKAAKRDPELYGLYLVTAAVFAWAGWRFVQSPTGSDYSAVAIVPDSEPWKDGGQASSGKYKYHPYNDVNRPAKDAPSPLNTVVVPNVTLPKHLHDAYNKWGKPEYEVYAAGSGANYDQDSVGKSKNVLTGEPGAPPKSGY